MTGLYLPRHRAPVDLGDISQLVRMSHDQVCAKQAVRVLAATDTLPAARKLYRELHRAGVLLAPDCRTVLAADVIARELGEVAA